MSIADLAERLGVSPSTVLRFEQSEQSGRIQLDTLTRVADQLGCDVVYALVPRQPLEKVVDDRARELAVEELRGVGHTMELEAQGLSADRMAERVEELAKELKARPGLWRVPRAIRLNDVSGIDWGEDPEGATPLDEEQRAGLRLSWVSTRADLNRPRPTTSSRAAEDGEPEHGHAEPAG